MPEMPPQTTPVWFITGCYTGFGRQLAGLVLHRGYRAVLTARGGGDYQSSRGACAATWTSGKKRRLTPTFRRAAPLQVTGHRRRSSAGEDEGEQGRSFRF